MLDILYNLELKFFFLVNKSISNFLFDNLFTFIHDAHKNSLFLIIILLILFLSVFKDKKNRVVLILCIPLAIIITDQIGRFIKNLEIRDRPYMTIEQDKMNLLVKAKKDINGNYLHTESSRKSFPSNHSANIFALYFILSSIYKSKSKYFLVTAFIVAISRIYVGVHYPLDVISGALIGLSVGFLLNRLLIQNKLIR